MAGQFWENDPVVGGASTQAGPSLRPVLSVPDARADREEMRDNTRLDMSLEDQERAARGETRQIGEKQFQQVEGLRKEWSTKPEVKAYRVAIQQLDQALGTGDGAQNDLALTYAFAKAMDPESVVRESEQAMVTNAQPWFQAAVENTKKQFGMDGSGTYSPEARAAIRQQIINSVASRRQQYGQQRKYYTDFAQRYGFDPIDVVGPDDGEAYLDRFAAYDAKLKDGKGSANAPEMRGGLPVGTDVAFGMDGGGGTPFDRTEWLQQTYGVTPDQEAATVAFWNANAGNQALTPEAAAQWYQSNGITMPTPEALQQSVVDARAGHRFTGFDASAAQKAYEGRLDAALDQEGFDPTGVAGYADRFVQGGLAGTADEIYGVQGGIEKLFANEGVGDGYRFNRDVMRRAHEREREAQGLGGDLLELGGGLTTGVLLPGGAGAAGAARTGAGAGAVAGWGYGEGLGGSLRDAAIGTATGAGVGFAAGRGVEALQKQIGSRTASRATQPLTEGGEVISAADRLNKQFGTKIAPIPADVSGPGIRNATGGAAKLPLSAQPIVRGAERVTEEARAARDAISRMAGNSSPTLEGSGEAALMGARKYIERSKTKVDALYAKARRLGGDEPVDLATARQALDDHIAELSQTPGGAPGLAELQKLRGELDEMYPAEGVKRMRSTLRDRFLGEGLRGSDLERRVGHVVDAADQDITDAFVRAGRTDAANAYSEAAAAHKERVGVIDSVLTPIIGKAGEKSGEQIMTAIGTATKQNNARLGQFLRSLPSDDAATVRATLISGLGKVGKGTQNADGTEFSLSQFLTHWNDITPQAKSTLFGGELRSALDDLARVAEGTKEAQRFANFSNTGSPIGLLATGGLASQFLAAPVSTTLFLVGQYGGGKLLSSPSFARWVAKMPSQPSAAQQHIKHLPKIAANDTGIAADIIGLREALESALSAAPLKAAAAPSAENTRTGAAGQ